jgi:hypothetical protein
MVHVSCNKGCISYTKVRYITPHLGLIELYIARFMVLVLLFIPVLLCFLKRLTHPTFMLEFFLFLWGASCCITYMYTYQIYTSQLIISISFILSIHYMFRPLRAILKWTTTSSLIYVFMKTIIQQHIHYFYNYSPIWCTSLIIYLSTLQSIMITV